MNVYTMVWMGGEWICDFTAWMTKKIIARRQKMVEVQVRISLPLFIQNHSFQGKHPVPPEGVLQVEACAGALLRLAVEGRRGNGLALAASGSQVFLH